MHPKVFEKYVQLLIDILPHFKPEGGKCKLCKIFSFFGSISWVSFPASHIFFLLSQKTTILFKDNNIQAFEVFETSIFLFGGKLDTGEPPGQNGTQKWIEIGPVWNSTCKTKQNPPEIQSEFSFHMFNKELVKRN